MKFERLCFQSSLFGSCFILFGTELNFITNVDGRYDTGYALELYNYNLRTIGPRGPSVSQSGSGVSIQRFNCRFKGNRKEGIIRMSVHRNRIVRL